MSRKLSLLHAVALFSFSLMTTAVPIVRREVPQEHSHERFLVSVTASLQANNPAQIQDAVFGLLGNAAAATGAGAIADATCLQQATADQAFTNAKAAGNIQGQVDALIYRALERNTGRVGQVSDPCTSIQAVNPEIAALQQHQDPASPNAAAVNKAIVLELARQIASVGGNPQDALLSGTFAPGDVNDPTGRGNTCDDLDDPVGCIFTKNLIVFDASVDEINAAVGGGDGNNGGTQPGNGAANCPPPVTVTVTAGNATPTANAGSPGSAVRNNLQAFSGSLAGIAAPTVIRGGRGFRVENNAEILNIGAALGRSCDVQHNQCANFANSAAGRAAGVSVGECGQQRDACRAAIA